MLANILLISILRKDKKKKTVFLTTIFSLGIADLLVSLVLAYSGLYFLCQELKIFAESQEFFVIFLANLIFCQTSSFFHVLFISTERFMAVFYPLRFRRVFTRKKCIAVLAVIWIASLPTSLRTRQTEILLQTSYFCVSHLPTLLLFSYMHSAN